MKLILGILIGITIILLTKTAYGDYERLVVKGATAGGTVDVIHDSVTNVDCYVAYGGHSGYGGNSYTAISIFCLKVK